MSTVVEPKEELLPPVSAGEEEKKGRLSHLLTLISCSAIVIAAALLQLDGPRRVAVSGLGMRIPELCTYHRFTGLDCPGCGMTRSFISMAHGRILAAFRFHPLGALLFLGCAAQIPFQLIQLARLRRGIPPLRFPRLNRAAIAVGLAVIVLFTFYRMGSQYLDLWTR